MNIGIDLGTTFSVIAVKGQVKLADGYPAGQYVPECDTTVIPTPEGDPTFPSVVWVGEDALQPGKELVLVGMEAKQKGLEGSAPIMFSKRAIGTNLELRFGDRMFTATQVATYVLKYLKECAERALGQPVSRAVITHPAYFDPNQIQATREAAKAAGFEMSLPEQMMMEPVAAALAYTQGVEKDPLRVMTYDLGGGTFDVTILERSQGVINMRTFDGDHLLGGYNFDDAFAQWVLDQLKAQGRNIPYDESNPQHQAQRGQLLQYAETLKIAVSQTRGPKVPVNVKVDFLVDDQGRRAQFVGRITQEEYAALIKTKLDKTIECCQRALDKVSMQPAELDAILLVGGSTYGPWVKRCVSDAFSKDVEPYYPDLCVAAGAAVKAAEIRGPVGSAEFELTLEVDATSPLPSINVAGQVRRKDGTELDDAAVGELILALTTPDQGVMSPTTFGSGGTFLFEGVTLPEEGRNEFELKLLRVTTTCLKTDFAVAFQPQGARIIDVQTSLPKPLYLRTAEGLVSLAEEGQPLPVRKEIRLVRLYSDPTVEVPVIQESEQVGVIRLENLPPDAGAGCTVVISVEITQKMEMRGKGQVMTRTKSVAAERPISVTFPPIEVPDLSELQGLFDEIYAKYEELLVLSPDPEQRLTLGGKGKRLAGEIQEEFRRQAPDRQILARDIRALQLMVNPPQVNMDPPREDFRGLLDNCREMLAQKQDDANLRSFGAMLDRIEKEGNEAFTTRNHRRWAQSNERLQQTAQRLHKLVMGGDGGGGGGGGGGGRELPETPILKDQFKQIVEGLRSALQTKQEEAERLPDYESKLRPRVEAVSRSINQIEQAIDKVDDGMEPKRALAALQLAVRLEKDIRTKAIPHIIGDLSLQH